MPLVTGQVINQRYRIIRLLGQGGFGAVYQAWDQNLDRACALKENLDASDELSRQFEREARLLANLNHPGLPRVIDHFRIPGQGQYLVMDYIEGEDLEQRLARLGRPLSEAEALNWVTQVAAALTYLHRHDPPIIHRDIKPANIRITPQGQAVLVDFGIAKLYGAGLRTTVGARAFTPGFSPPEQYGRGDTDERSDGYALGATLYTLLTGQAPPDSVDLLAGNAGPLRPVSGLNPQVSERVSQAVSQAMQPARQQRYQNVEQFVQALRGTGPVAAIPPTMQAPVVAKTERRAVANGPGGTQVGGAGARPSGGAAQGAGARPSDSAAPGSAARSAGGAPAAGSVPRRRSAPVSRPARAASWPVLIGGGVIGLVLMALLVGLGAMGLLNGSPRSNSPQAAASLTSLPAAETPQTALPAIDTQAPDTPTIPQATAENSAFPTVSLSPPAESVTALPPGVVRLRLTGARLAFVSNHLGDGRERIYLLSLRGGEYWYDLESVQFFRLSDGAPTPVLSALQPLPADDQYDMAWWPEWCQDDTRLLYEAQDTRQTNFQALYQVALDDPSAVPEMISWDGFRMLGVPRCAHHSSTVLVSALPEGGNETWKLHYFDLDNPTQGQPVLDGFPFAGNAAWAPDDAWIVFMRRLVPGPVSFALVRLPVSEPSDDQTFVQPAGMMSSRYPDISQLNEQIVFACANSDEWHLCRSDADGTRAEVLLSGLSPLSTSRTGAQKAVPPVTPRWSPDGAWIAYSALRNGNWHIFLYSPTLKVEIPLTSGLSGDQFQPSWSQHEPAP